MKSMRTVVSLMVALMVSLLVGSLAWAEPKLDEDLDPGQYQWQPDVSPSGPVVMIVSIPEQIMHVYRGGVRIGWATATTGKEGHETPTGVYKILRKDADHTSNLYNDAPMPWAQRLTWDGIFFHGGSLHRLPASHGCIRLPEAFAKQLFQITDIHDPAIIAGASFDRSIVYPGNTLPVDAIAQLDSKHIDNSHLVVKTPQGDPPAPVEKADDGQPVAMN